MAHFSESLCEEVIKTEGKCGLTSNEMTQMARFALRAIRNENPWMRDGLRYRWLREAVVMPASGFETSQLLTCARSWPIALHTESLDGAIDEAMSGKGPACTQAASTGAR